MKTILFNLLFFAFKKKPAVFPRKPSRILVIRQDNRIGNLILITPFLTLLKKRWPSARVNVVTGGSFGRVLEGNPDIDGIFIYDQLRFIRMPWLFFFFIFHLRRQHFDLVFDLKPVFSFNNMMLTVLCGAAHRSGFQNTLSDPYFHDAVPLPNPNLYEGRFLAELLVRHMTVDPLPALRYFPEPRYVKEAAQWIASCSLSRDRLVGIHAGGRGAKKIDPERWAVLAERLKKEGYSPFFFIGPDEAGDCAFFESRGFPCAAPDRIGRLGGFLPHLRLFVSGDTGPMHMAAGAGVLTVSFFSATSRERYAPQGPGNVSRTIGDGDDLPASVLPLLAGNKS